MPRHVRCLITEIIIILLLVILNRIVLSKVLSQASSVAQSSLEIQRINSNKIVELSQTIISMEEVFREASKTSSGLLNILNLLKESNVSSSEVQKLKDGIDFLTSRAQGQSFHAVRIFEPANFESFRKHKPGHS